MKELETIWEERRFDRQPSFTRQLAAFLQPGSFSELGQHTEFAEAFRRFTQGDAFRGMDVGRLWSLILNLKHVLGKCPGSVAELGVYKGQSSAVLSFFAEMAGRTIYLADTFEGFGTEQYESGMGAGKEAAFKDTSFEDAKRVVGDYAGNEWIVGLFPASVTDRMRADTYAFVSIDCDLYTPIIEGLRFFWPRMDPGGQIFIHDYSSGHWPGATRAVDEFCRSEGLSGVLLPDFSGTFVLSAGT